MTMSKPSVEAIFAFLLSLRDLVRITPRHIVVASHPGEDISGIASQEKGRSLGCDDRTCDNIALFVPRLHAVAAREPVRWKSSAYQKRLYWSQRRAKRLARMTKHFGIPSNQLLGIFPNYTRLPSWESQISVDLALALAQDGFVVPLSKCFNLISTCAHVGAFDDAESLVMNCVHKNHYYVNGKLCASLIRGMCACGNANRAKRLEKAMREAGTKLSSRSTTIVISSFFECGEIEAALDIIQRIRNSFEFCDVVLSATMLKVLKVCGAEDVASKFLEEIQAKEGRTSSRPLVVMLSEAVKNNVSEAFRMFGEFVTSGGRPHIQMYNILILSLAKEGQLSGCEKLFAQLDRRAISGYGRGHHQNKRSAERILPDVYTYNAMMHACLKVGRPQRMLAYRRMMKVDGVAIDAASLTSITLAYVELEQPLRAVAEARHALETGQLKVLHEDIYKLLFDVCAKASFCQQDAAEARDHALWLVKNLEREQTKSIMSLSHKTRNCFHDKVRAVTGKSISLQTDWMRNVIRTLGNAGDLDGAKNVFRRCPYPDWILTQEMIGLLTKFKRPLDDLEELYETKVDDDPAISVLRREFLDKFEEQNQKPSASLMRTGKNVRADSVGARLAPILHCSRQAGYV